MSTTSPYRNNLQPRPPLQPRETPLDENGKQCSTSESSSSLSNSVHKKLNYDYYIACENEPLTTLIQNKRQRTKSGSDLMNSDNWNNTENISSKPTDNTICDKNYKNVSISDTTESSTMKDHNTNCSLSVENQVNKLFSSKSERQCNNFKNNNGVNYCKQISEESCIQSLSENINGDLSPHCVATMEYVTQLPEGCSNSNICSNLVCPDSDDELEDDDNYLDSSEPEENDLETCFLPVEEEDESCGEGNDNYIYTN